MSRCDIETVSALLAGIECDELDWELQELRDTIEERRRYRWEREHPVLGPPIPRELQPKPLGLADFDLALRDSYAPALREAINHIGTIFSDVDYTPPQHTRRQKLRAWWTNHRPHLVFGPVPDPYDW